MEKEKRKKEMKKGERRKERKRERKKETMKESERKEKVMWEDFLVVMTCHLWGQNSNQ